MKGIHKYLSRFVIVMESVINQKQKFITTKEDKLNHGIGLENVSGTVKKYDGDMRISQENERFIVTINI